MAFDFENLEVYKSARIINQEILKLLKIHPEINRSLKDQIIRAASSIMLNIAEGSGRFTKPDKRNFYIIARGSVFECVAILDIFKDSSEISAEEQSNIYQMLEKQSRMMWGIIQSLN